MNISRREFGVITLGFVAARSPQGTELTVSIALSADGASVIATVLGDGDVGLESGFTRTSSMVPSNGSGSVVINLGPSTPGVYWVNFVRGGDSYAAITGIGSDQSLTVIDATGSTVDNLPSNASPDLLMRFWSGFTKARFDSILGGAIQDWIVANAAGAPALLVVGIVLGPLDLAFLTGVLAKAGDLFALVISKIAQSEVSDGTISSDEAAIIKGVVGVVDLITQLPAIITDESKVSKIASSISAANGIVSSFTSENSAVQLTVTLQADSVGKYVLALKALTSQ